MLNSCKKEDIPPIIADFDYTETTNGTVNFFNTSLNADTYEWDFNTGDNSTSKSPSYTFANNKDYVVTLTARGKAGQNSKSKTIRITTKPTTGKYAFFTNWANSGFVDIYVNGVYEGRLTKYFLSGSPTCGDDGTVTVTRMGGTYLFTAKSTNGTTWNTIITIVNGGCGTTKLSQ